MTKPVYKIEVWEPGASSALHTIEEDAYVFFKEILTDAIGHFNFTVPTKKNGNYLYNDIDLNDIVKIWLGYGSVSGDPDFVGKVQQIRAPLSSSQGYVRHISGLSQGAVLLQRLKTNKIWTATDASVIVTELATDLGLGTSQIETETIDVDLEVETERYFDVLRKVSDFWYDASNQIKKDFYVTVDNDLKWASRPFRTSGVESFTVGENILQYRVTRPLLPVKNAITVYGINEKSQPSDMDSWTEDTTDNWASSGTLSVDASEYRVGNNCIKSVRSSAYGVYMERTFSPLSFLYPKEYRQLRFFIRADYPATTGWFEHRLFVYTDATNYFYIDVNPPTNASWSEYSVVLGPRSNWLKWNSPDWSSISKVRDSITSGVSGAWTMRLDGLHFFGQRFSGSASDATSQTNYDQRDLEVIDPRLTSDGDCNKRAETLLYQKKDPPIQLEMTVPGNTNVLVGDQLSMTLPAENISSVNFDVLSVEQAISDNGFMTKASMVNTVNIRELIETNTLQLLAKMKRVNRQLSMNERII